MRRTINSALGLMIAVIATVVSSVIVLAYASQPSITLEGGPAAAGVTLLTVMDGSVLALPSGRQTLVGLDSTDHQTIDLGFVGAPTAVHFDYQGRIVALTDNAAHILEHSGREIRQFKVPTASGMALVGSDIVLAASTARSRIQVFSRQGHRLAEFGSPQQIEVADPRENQFLNEGLVVAGPANSFFFIFSRTPNPLIEQWTATGQKVREFRPEGIALQRQSEAITNYLAWRAVGDTGGLAAISAAAFDPGSGHLWLATTAERPEMPNVYEYDIAGTKLAEYSLHRDAGYLPFISQLVASQGRLFVLADSTAYLFALPATVRLADSISATPAFRVVSAIHSLLAVRPETVVFAQFSCGAEDASFTCTRNCTAGPAVDCKSPSFWGNDPIVAHSCSTVDNQCSLTVTTCTSSTGNINHGPETKRCPTDDDQDGYEAMADCDDSAWNIHPGAPTNCQAGQDMDCDGRDDFDACYSPILVDLGGDGFRLTGADQGVRFDLDGDGNPEQLGWTAANVENAWLAIDRNGNGRIDNGSELFGNFSPQPLSARPNGFLALAVFDTPAQGGNDDDRISREDAVWNSLLIWRDRNHNGISDAGEVSWIEAAGIESIALDYKESDRRDRFGNVLRYRSKVSGPSDQLGRWAVDVFLTHRP